MYLCFRILVPLGGPKGASGGCKNLNFPKGNKGFLDFHEKGHRNHEFYHSGTLKSHPNPFAISPVARHPIKPIFKGPAILQLK